MIRHFKLGFEVEETLRIGDRFYTKPLLEGLSESGTFYIFALSGGASACFGPTRRPPRKWTSAASVSR